MTATAAEALQYRDHRPVMTSVPRTVPPTPLTPRVRSPATTIWNVPMMKTITCVGTFVHTTSTHVSVATPTSLFGTRITSAVSRLRTTVVLVTRRLSAELGESYIDQNHVMGCAMRMRNKSNRVMRIAKRRVIGRHVVTPTIVYITDFICAGTYVLIMIPPAPAMAPP